MIEKEYRIWHFSFPIKKTDPSGMPSNLLHIWLVTVGDGTFTVAPRLFEKSQILDGKMFQVRYQDFFYFCPTYKQ